MDPHDFDHLPKAPFAGPQLPNRQAWPTTEQIANVAAAMYPETGKPLKVGAYASLACDLWVACQEELVRRWDLATSQTQMQHFAQLQEANSIGRQASLADVEDFHRLSEYANAGDHKGFFVVSLDKLLKFALSTVRPEDRLKIYKYYLRDKATRINPSPTEAGAKASAPNDEEIVEMVVKAKKNGVVLESWLDELAGIHNARAALRVIAFSARGQKARAARTAKQNSKKAKK